MTGPGRFPPATGYAGNRGRYPNPNASQTEPGNRRNTQQPGPLQPPNPELAQPQPPRAPLNPYSTHQPQQQRMLIGQYYITQRNRLQEQYKNRRQAVRQQAANAGLLEPQLKELLRREQQLYKQGLLALQGRVNIQPCYMDATLINCKNDEDEYSIDPQEFKLLSKCCEFMNTTVPEGFSNVNLVKEHLASIEGQTYVIHPTFDNARGEPYHEKAAQISLSSCLSLDQLISVLAHEFSSHLIPRIHAAENGDSHLEEEEEHFANLNTNCAYHQNMMRIKDNWPKIAELAHQLELDVSLADVMDHYATDIGLQTNSYLTHLGLDSDHIEQLTEDVQAGKVATHQLPQNVQSGLQANLFYENVRKMANELE